MRPNVRVLACGLSMTRHKVERESLIEGMGYVENGLLECLRLLVEGWDSAEL